MKVIPETFRVHNFRYLNVIKYFNVIDKKLIFDIVYVSLQITNEIIDNHNVINLKVQRLMRLNI